MLIFQNSNVLKAQVTKHARTASTILWLQCMGGCPYHKSGLIPNKAARNILAVHSFNPNAVLPGTLVGWLTIQKTHSMLRFWNRLVGMPNDMVTKKSFKWDYENNSNSWCSDVKHFSTSDM